MKLKNILALLMVVVISFGILSACSDTSYILKAGDKKYPVGPYAFYAYWMRDTFDVKMQSYQQVFSEALLQDVDEQGTKLWQLIINQTKDQYLTHILISEKFQELDLSLTDEQKESIESSYTTKWVEQYGEQNFKNIMKTLDITEDEFKELISIQFKNEALIDYYFGEGGSKEIPENELRNKYIENYARFKYIILAKTTQDGSDLSFDEIAVKKASADEALSKAQNDNVPFEDLVKEYSEDYVKLTNDMSDEQKQAAEAQNTESVEKGLIIDKDGIFNDILYDYYGISVDTTIVDKIFSMNIGEITFIELGNSFWVIKKYDLNEKEEYFESKKDNIFNELAQPDIDEMFETWSNELAFEFNPKTVNKYDPRGLKTLFLTNNPPPTE